MLQHKIALTMRDIPVEIIYGIGAVAGGVARYLKSYVSGEKFKLSIFTASAFIAGFSGLMFALLGETMGVPVTMIHVMAGIGGFFGDQTLKFIMESITKRGLNTFSIDEIGQIRQRTAEDKETKTQRKNEDTETLRQRTAEDKETQKQRKN